MPANTEMCSRESQERLAVTIRAFWAGKGQKVLVTVEPAMSDPEKGTNIGWRVVTDMRGGYPLPVFNKKLMLVKDA